MNDLQKLIDDARLAAKCLCDEGSFETGQAILEDCADRLAELQGERDTLVAAAYEDAAKICTGCTDRPAPIPASKFRRMEIGLQFAHTQLALAWNDADKIRARTSDDAKAALEQVKREAHEEAIKEVARHVSDLPEINATRVALNILALIEKDKTDES